MTDHTPLSPAAQAAKDHFLANVPISLGHGLAAVLRAAADQVVPPDPCGNDCCITQCEEIRSEFLAIAAELEALHND